MLLNKGNGFILAKQRKQAGVVALLLQGARWSWMAGHEVTNVWVW